MDRYLQKAGRDRGKCYIIVRFDEKGYAYVANGEEKSVQSPKRKNVKHLDLSGDRNDVIGDKFLEDLNAEHPFKESFKAIHFTEDGYIIHETYDGVPIDNNSILMTRTQKAMGYLAYFYKLDDIKSVMMYTHTVKMVNKYGHGNSVMSTTYMVSLLDENLRPIIPEVRCTGKMDKSLAKKIKKGDLKYVSVGFELEADSATFAQMVKRYRPDIGEVDYDQVRERLKTK